MPALRGVGDKASAPAHDRRSFGRRTELGVGFSHGGALSTLREAVLRPDPALPGGSVDLTPQEADQVTAFLEAFDTGIAPAAGYIATAHLGNLAVFAQTELSFLEDQAERGNCDLIFLRGPRKLPSGGLVYLAGQLRPGDEALQPASSCSPELSQAAVLGDVLTGRPVTFVGLPLGMGRAIGLDRDMDGLLDLDEVRHGSNRERFDTDGDQYPDGYEVQWGMDPTQPDTSSPDHQPPVLNGPARVLWTTTNTVKFEFETNEMSRVLVSYNGGYPVQRVPLGLPDFVTEHQVVLDGLEPDMTYVVHLELFDPSGNKQTDKSLVVQTDALQFGTPSFVDEISLSIQPGSSPSLTAQVRLETGSQPAGAGYIVTGAVYRLSITGALSVVSLGVTSPTGPKGVVRLKYDLPQPGLPSTLIFVLTDVQSPGNGAPYVQGMSHVSHATTRY